MRRPGRPKGTINRPRKSAASPVFVEAVAEEVSPVEEKFKQVASDLGSIKPKRASKGLPTTNDWTPFVSKVLFYLSIGYVWWLTEEDPDNHGELLMQEAEAVTIASPIARLFAQSELNKRFGRKIIDSNDIIAAVVVAGLYFKRTAPYFQAKINRAMPRKGVQPNVNPRPDAGPQVPGIDPNFFDAGF
jgi:hypothetical protein